MRRQARPTGAGIARNGRFSGPFCVPLGIFGCPGVHQTSVKGEADDGEGCVLLTLLSARCLSKELFFFRFWR